MSVFIPDYSSTDDESELFKNEWIDYNQDIQIDEENTDSICRSYQNVLTSNLYRNKPKGTLALNDYDIIITYSWNGLAQGPVSAWYDAFELWYMVQFNTLSTDLGGRKIALLFPDCPDHRTINQIVMAITSKYHLNDTMYNNLCKHIYFINQPKELLLSKGQIPYKKYSPSNVVFVDGKIPYDTRIQADNIYLQLLDNIKEEQLNNLNYNFLLIYLDKRIYQVNEEYRIEGFGKNLIIPREAYPNTLVFDDIRRINFSIFKKFPEREVTQEESEYPKKKRFLIYVTPKNRKIHSNIKTNEPKWSLKELDDIIDSIPSKCINPLGLKIRANQKELYTRFKSKQGFTPDQKLLLKNVGEIFGNGYTESDVIIEDPKAHIVIVGLTDEDRDFESALLARAITRGINISIEVYLERDLPIENIHSIYDTYIFTPAINWTTSRFIPEALYHSKDIIITKHAQKSMKWNLPLFIRYHDSEKYLMFLAEDDVFKKPKSKIAKNLLGNWQ